MLNNHKMIKELENKISKLEGKIPDEHDIRNIAFGVIEAKKAELSDIYEVRRRTREEAWEAITSNIEGTVEQRLPALIEEATKDIQDKLLVELARKAMGLDKEEK